MSILEHDYVSMNRSFLTLRNLHSIYLKAPGKNIKLNSRYIKTPWILLCYWNITKVIPLTQCNRDLRPIYVTKGLEPSDFTGPNPETVTLLIKCLTIKIVVSWILSLRLPEGVCRKQRKPPVRIAEVRPSFELSTHEYSQNITAGPPCSVRFVQKEEK